MVGIYSVRYVYSSPVLCTSYACVSIVYYCTLMSLATYACALHMCPAVVVIQLHFFGLLRLDFRVVAMW